MFIKFVEIFNLVKIEYAKTERRKLKGKDIKKTCNNIDISLSFQLLVATSLIFFPGLSPNSFQVYFIYSLIIFHFSSYLVSLVPFYDF